MSDVQRLERIRSDLAVHAANYPEDMHDSFANDIAWLVTAYDALTREVEDHKQAWITDHDNWYAEKAELERQLAEAQQRIAELEAKYEAT